MALLFCNKSDHIYCSELPKRELILSVLKRVYKLLYKQSTKTYKHEISPPPPQKNPDTIWKKITRHHKIFLMSPAHTIVYHTKYSYYAKNWKIDIFRFSSWKLWKPATFHIGLYSNFALFASLHICDLYFDITSGSRGSLKGKDIIIIRNYKQYTISKKKKIQIFCQTIFVLQSRYITIRTNHIYLRVQICSCFWFHWAIAPVNTNDMC